MSEAQLPDTTGLASQINEEHNLAEESAQKALSHAMKCGELLCWAKEHVQHGLWSQWLESNFEASPQTARTYMRLYRNRDQLENESALSVREANRLLASPAEDEDEPVVHVPPQFGDEIPVSEAARIVREAVSYHPLHWIGDGVNDWLIRRDAGVDGDWDKTCREHIGADPILVKCLLEEATTDVHILKDNTLIRHLGSDLAELDGRVDERSRVQKAIVEKRPPYVSEVAEQLRWLEASGEIKSLGYESIFDYAKETYDFDREVFEMLLSAA